MKDKSGGGLTREGYKVDKNKILELLVQLEMRNATNLRLWKMYEEDGKQEEAQRYSGQHSGLEEAITEIRKAANIDYLEHVANCIAQGVGQQ